MVVGVAVLREGSEVVLFLYGIAAQGGTSPPAWWRAARWDWSAGAAVSALMYFGLLTIPAGRLFQVTSRPDHLAGGGHGGAGGAVPAEWRLAQCLHRHGVGHVLAVQGRQYRRAGCCTPWSAIVEAPDGAQLIAYLATIALILVLMRLVPQGASRPRPA